MFNKTKINKHIDKRKSARNYCNNEYILMNGIWLMKGYPEPNAPLQRTLNTMGDIKDVQSVIDRTLDAEFKYKLYKSPVQFEGARGLYNVELKQYHFINNDFLEMIDLSKCKCIGTKDVYGPVIFENTYDSDEKWLLVMPMRLNSVDKWLKKPKEV